MTNYNRRPTTQPKYDKIYYIALNQTDPLKDSLELDELFGKSGFVKNITEYSMNNSYKPGTTTEFISIQLTTTDMDQNTFFGIASKINNKFDKKFKLWMKTASGNKYSYLPVETPKDTTNKSVMKFLED